MGCLRPEPPFFRILEPNLVEEQPLSDPRDNSLREEHARVPLAVARVVEAERPVLIAVWSLRMDLRTKDPYLRRLPRPILELEPILGGLEGGPQRSVPSGHLASLVDELGEQLPQAKHLQLQGERLSSPFTPRRR